MQQQDDFQAAVDRAIARERERRQIAFCDTLLPICGVWVRQFTPAHWVALGLVGSPFMGGERTACFSRSAVLQFLWVVSPEYRPGALLRQLWFYARHFSAIHPATALEIYRYLDAAFMDAPQGGAGGAGGKSYYSSAASLVDFFGSQYGWDDTVTMSKPLARLFQLYNAARQRMKPDVVLFNPSDREIGRMVHARAVAASRKN